MPDSNSSAKSSSKPLQAFLILLPLLLHVPITALKDCGNKKKLSVAWANLPPYIFKASSGMAIEGALHEVIINMTNYCCGDEYK